MIVWELGRPDATCLGVRTIRNCARPGICVFNLQLLQLCQSRSKRAKYVRKRSASFCTLRYTRVEPKSFRPASDNVADCRQTPMTAAS